MQSGKPPNGGMHSPEEGTTTIGGRRVKTAYLYIGGLIGAIIVLFFFVRMLNTSLTMHVNFIAGLLLLFANIREFFDERPTYANQRSNVIALHNALIGGALVCAWLTKMATTLFWIPSIILLASALPLTFGMLSVYGAYVRTADNISDSFRKFVGRS